MSDHNNHFYYQCSHCDKEFSPAETMYLCPDCAKNNRPEVPPKGVLHTRYDFEYLRKKLSYSTFLEKDFFPLLPVQNKEYWPNLNTGHTPLYRVENKKMKGVNLFLKDDSQNPSFSFKDRASALVSAYSKARGIQTLVTASTGNAGSSLAAICANQGQRAVVMVPASAPVAKLMQILWYGARIIPVKGTYDEAFDLSIEATAQFGWYNRNTAYNPLTIEGKKTVAFELFEQMNRKVPDNIFVPVGDGVIISGVYKGFEDLLNMGWLDRMPHIIAVQSSNSDNLVRNLTTSDFRVNPTGSVADSITVDVPRNFHVTQNYIRKYEGSTLTASDEAIIVASAQLSKNYGLFAEPAAAAAYAGFIQGVSTGMVESGDSSVVLLTGSGLKDIAAIEKKVHLPEPVEPDIDQLKSLFND